MNSIIFSNSLLESIANLILVFIQLDKLQFLKSNTEFLGHVTIFMLLNRIQKKKIQALQKYSIPNPAKEITQITKPLTKSLKKSELE